MKLSIFFLHGKWENASADKWKFSLKTPDLHRNCTPPFWKFSGVSPNLTGPAQKLLLHSPVVPGMHGVISVPFSFSVTVIELSMLYSLLPVPTCLSQCRWRHLGDQTELHLAMLGEISSVTTSCVCQTGGVTVGCARQIFINSQDLLEDVGSLSEYSLSSDLRSFSFWGCEEQHFLPLCSSVQFLFVLFFFLFHISAIWRETFWFSLVWILPWLLVCSHEIQDLRLITELTSFCSGFPVLHQGSNLEDLPHLSCLSASTSQSLVQGSSVEHSRSSFLHPKLWIWYPAPGKLVPSVPLMSVVLRFHPVGRIESFLYIGWM